MLHTAEDLLTGRREWKDRAGEHDNECRRAQPRKATLRGLAAQAFDLIRIAGTHVRDTTSGRRKLPSEDGTKKKQLRGPPHAPEIVDSTGYTKVAMLLLRSNPPSASLSKASRFLRIETRIADKKEAAPKGGF